MGKSKTLRRIAGKSVESSVPPKPDLRLVEESKSILRLDLGCGQHKREGFKGVDIVKTEQADFVHDLLKFPWPWKDDSVEEVHCSHFFEHIPGKLRGRWMDELYRILKPEGTAQIICPYYASARAVQDYTHEWPPIAEWSFLYFNAGWRKQNGLDHYDVKCDFDFTYGISVSPNWQARNDEAKQFAMSNYWNAGQDIIVTLTSRKGKKE